LAAASVVVIEEGVGVVSVYKRTVRPWTRSFVIWQPWCICIAGSPNPKALPVRKTLHDKHESALAKPLHGSRQPWAIHSGCIACNRNVLSIAWAYLLGTPREPLVG
jgi:hypothetical protein